MAFTARMKDLMRKYGKVALGVHVSVSSASVAGLYVAINNNVDVDAIFSRFGIHTGVQNEGAPAPSIPDGIPSVDTVSAGGEAPEPEPARQRNRTMELAASGGGALALALVCNKALLPVRIPITIALTPPIARFLARMKLAKA